MIRVTFVLLLLPCFFDVATYADVFPYELLELPGQNSFPQSRTSFYDTSVQPQARPQALVEWNPVSKNCIPTIVRQNLIIRSVKLQVDLLSSKARLSKLKVKRIHTVAPKP